MRDRVIEDLLTYHRASFEDAEGPHNLEELAHKMGYRIVFGRTSLFAPPDEITLARGLPRRIRKMELAHELSHGLTMQKDPEDPDAISYEEVIRYEHAHVPDMDGHLELLATAGGDEFAMPAALVEVILKLCGWTAQAVWELARWADVPLADALRRIVQFDSTRRIAGFISSGGFIQRVASQMYRLPVWVGNRVPEPHVLLGEGVSVFRVPHRLSQQIVLVTAGQFEAA